MNTTAITPGIIWTPEICLDALHAWVKEHGRVPSSNTDWKNSGYGRPAARSIDRIFGSWNAFIVLGGYEPNRPGLQPHERYWTPDRIAEAMLDFLIREGRWPMVPDWRYNPMKEGDFSRPGFETVMRVFGTWKNAKVYAGWPCRCERCNKHLGRSARAYQRWCSEACRRAEEVDRRRLKRQAALSA